jgi:PAS domain S-box-containing protein
MPNSVKLLILAGRETDAAEFVNALLDTGIDGRHERVDAIEAFEATLAARRWDAVLWETGLPEIAVADILQVLADHGVDIPVIAISDSMTAEVAADLVLAGASDIVLKSNLSRLASALHRGLVGTATRMKERRAEAAQQAELKNLRRTADIFIGFMDNTPEIISLKDPDGRFIFINKQFGKTLNITSAEALGKKLADFVPHLTPDFDAIDKDVLKSGEPIVRDLDEVFDDGTIRRVRMRKFPVLGADGNVIGIGNIASDITELKRREADFRDQRRRMGLVTDNLPIMIVYLDPERRYRYVNETSCEWFNRSYDEIIGRTIGEILSSESHDIVQSYIDKVEAGATVQFQSRIDYPDGVTRDIEAIYVPHVGDDGELKGYCAMVTDISDRVYAEETLRHNETRFRHLYNGTPAMMHSASRNGYLTNVSNFWLDILGYSRSEVIGRKLSDFLSPESALREMEYGLAERIDAGSCKNIDYQFVRKDGTVIDVLVSAVPDVDESGEAVDVLTVLTDVTDRKALESQVLQMQKIEAIGQLTGGVAHDFNNLLTVILGNVKLLENRLCEDEALMKRIDAIRMTAQRGADLTRRLMTFSRHQEMQVDAVDLADTVAGISSLIGRMLGEKIELETDLPRTLWALSADQNQLENALINILINSRDAMPDGGKIVIKGSNSTISDEDSSIPPGDYVRFSIADTGIGMPPEILKSIFNPFFTTKDVGKGTGLGLSMVHGFVAQSGGHLGAESTPGTGTTLTVHLPKANSAQQPKSRQQPKRDDARENAGGRIIVVEDEHSVRRIAVEVLRNAGYDVIDAGSGPEALKVLEENGAVDLLFTDIRMPEGMSGLQLARKVKERWPGTPVLYTSGYFEESLSEDDRLPEDATLLSKPYESSQLLEAVRLFLANDQGCMTAAPNTISSPVKAAG